MNDHPAIKPAYYLACFHCEAPLEDLPRVFGIVTACNPFGRILSSDENRQRDRDLEQQLISMGHPFFRISGGSRDGKHLEPGFGLWTLDAKALRELGQDWEQDAVFWITDGIVSMIACQEGSFHEVGSLAERWVDRRTD
ncbi:MAG: DUF3293 domain-containing protein [Limisphaerales bacterium]|jgi:hypothetical protein|nr:DUF3293 domain-containing protein [Verrucomicrobiota bacterium]